MRVHIRLVRNKVVNQTIKLGTHTTGYNRFKVDDRIRVGRTIKSLTGDFDSREKKLRHLSVVECLLSVSVGVDFSQSGRSTPNQILFLEKHGHVTLSIFVSFGEET